MSPANQDLLNLVNSSGFLFQLRVEQEITSTAAKHQKNVLAREHRWTHPRTSQEGYVDLVVSAGTNGKFIVECKRQRGGLWVFPVPDPPTPTKRVRILWTNTSSGGRQVSSWDEFRLRREFFESEFCIVRGQSDRDQPMLERASALLLSSVEAIANEELGYGSPVGWTGLRFYFPVIVTSCSLYICKLKPEEIHLPTGELSTGAFDQVPFLCFTKTMSTSLATSHPPSQITDAAFESRRTVFIVNAQHLVPFLTGGWEFDPPSNGPWPWDLPIWK